jgi:hypothetical protein
MKVTIYQHSAGDFKVFWGANLERHFMYDLGGAISFAVGLKIGALARGEEAEIAVNVRAPWMNRGFVDGFLLGHGDVTPAEAAYGGYTADRRSPPDDGRYTAHIGFMREKLVEQLH